MLAPFESWLILRGLKTLEIRMQQHCINARAIAEHLVGHPKILRVLYPGLDSHPQRDLALRQMPGGYGGMVTVELKGGRAAAEQFAARLRVFSLAESLGGVESLACHPATMTHGSIPVDMRLMRGITDGVIRLSVGIEHVDDLREDLEQALSGVEP